MIDHICKEKLTSCRLIFIKVEGSAIGKLGLKMINRWIWGVILVVFGCDFGGILGVPGGSGTRSGLQAFPDPFGAAPGRLLGASRAPPGCLLGASRAPWGHKLAPWECPMGPSMALRRLRKWIPGRDLFRKGVGASKSSGNGAKWRQNGAKMASTWGWIAC